MGQLESSLSKETTIYNYKLMKRKEHSIYKMVIYLVLVLTLLGKSISDGLWLPFIIGAPLIFAAHIVIVRVFFYFTVGGAMRGWSFRLGLFWNGVMPEGYASIRLVLKVQLHLLWIGLILIGMMYPWIDHQIVITLALFHLWMLLPRLWILLSFIPFRKNGLIRVSNKETSCYLP
ncbi:hypothetical protein [Paenibacillus eucommiae]|uniref:Transposase n=1 Tax=Paenibacillus eucommiae TaxID=1355755 RepID=A0ABS4J8N3_9BACL|nr:hypothetical protein [Paenibacillus eucommiae]MBP1996204.1 hypothetical protein [Paenibacillus eucommiae]